MDKGTLVLILLLAIGCYILVAMNTMEVERLEERLDALEDRIHVQEQTNVSYQPLVDDIHNLLDRIEGEYENTEQSSE